MVDTKGEKNDLQNKEMGIIICKRFSGDYL